MPLLVKNQFLRKFGACFGLSCIALATSNQLITGEINHDEPAKQAEIITIKSVGYGAYASTVGGRYFSKDIFIKLPDLFSDKYL